jgi:hypothetical protein
MPVYYFHIRDNGDLLEDPEGIELPTLDAASVECKELIVSVLREEQAAEESLAGREFQIEDATGRVVLVVPFQLASPARVGGG